LSRKAVHYCVEKFSKGRSKVADDARPGAEVTETTVKRFLCCGFRRTGKAMRQVYQCSWGICREINVFFSRFEYHIFYILQTFVTYLLILPLTYLSITTCLNIHTNSFTKKIGHRTASLSCNLFLMYVAVRVSIARGLLSY
jgi:hypothetical protein